MNSTPPPLWSLSGIFARTMFKTIEPWRLTDPKFATLVGASVEQLALWRIGDCNSVTSDNLVRFNHLIGIRGALVALLGDGPGADNWVNKSNSHPIFGGSSALEFMMGGDLDRIALVHRYVGAEAWGR